MATLAELLRQGADKLVNLPTQAQRFVTNPQAFVQLLTGKNALPRETGFAASATGLPPEQGTVLDPNYQAYMQGYEQGEPVSYAAMATPAAMPVAKALAPKAGQMAEQYMVNQGFMPSLIAYHGTPHTIKGKFDISKVGTGEGAQAYGHGMYFAENPKVAEAYRTGGIGAKTEFVSKYPEHDKALFVLRNKPMNDNDLMDLMVNDFKFSPEKAKQGIEEAKQTMNQSSNLYKVDIPDEYIPNMLYWDKPFKEQSKEVQKALKSMANQYGSHLKSVIKDNDIGEVIYKHMGNYKRNIEKAGANPDELVSKHLNEFGIRGIKYPDAGSRTTEGGTSNFVVFEPSDVKILEQNSKPMTRKEIIEQELEKVAK